MYKFLKYCDIQKDITDFWNINIDKIKPFYKNQGAIYFMYELKRQFSAVEYREKTHVYQTGGI